MGSLQPFNMTFRRSFFIALLFGLVPVVGLGLVAAQVAGSNGEADGRRRTQQAAETGAALVGERVDLVRAELAQLGQRSDFVTPALAAARGDAVARREAGQALADPAGRWWGFSAITVLGPLGPVVTTQRAAIARVDPGLLEAARDGEVAIGGWDDETRTFQIAQPLPGPRGLVAVVAEVPVDVVVGPLDDLDGVDLLVRDDAVARGDNALADAGQVTVPVRGSPWVVVASPMAEGTSIARLLLATSVAALVLVLVAAAGALVVGRTWTARLRRLTATADAIGAGHLERRTGLKGRDEVSRAAASLDRMADALVSDIAHRRQMETLLVNQALHDPLTGLANRAKLLDRLGDALARSNRSGQVVGLLFCDLDGFKEVNDRLGHSAGDDLLLLVADRLRAVVRPSDTVARFGGDEFVVLCPDLGSVPDAEVVAVRLAGAFAEPFQIGGSPVTVTSSIGIAVGAGGTSSPDDLLRRADQAMYEAKAAGKSQHVLFSLAPDEEERSRAERIAEVRSAMAEGDVTLHYQPVIDLRAGGVVGYEAFLRWHHRSRGEVRPQEFIELASSAGLSADVDLWVLDVALGELLPRRNDQLAPSWLSVNLTPGSLAAPGFSGRVNEVLARHTADPAWVVFEISEAALSGEPGIVLSSLDALHELGVGLAIDDFGTGHSSLDRLRRCPVDTIKIHQTLVHGLEAGADDRSAVAAIVSMAEALELGVVAEGVETEQQLATLRNLGCSMAQGYFIASPAPVAELGSGPTPA